VIDYSMTRAPKHTNLMDFDESDAMCDGERVVVKAEGGDCAVLCKRPDAAILRSETFPRWMTGNY
jgi:hypothetical protein